MGIDEIISLFGNLAVPVACLCACFWLWNKERDEHKAECEQFRQALENNTLVMQRICDKLGVDNDRK